MIRLNISGDLAQRVAGFFCSCRGSLPLRVYVLDMRACRPCMSARIRRYPLSMSARCVCIAAAAKQRL